MANTTNFGWETPDDTDLVKDGAAAMRTLGNAIDASLVDLKGGTTGQVLSKNTNTDMDFTWVTTDDANAIQNAIVDAKGDLIAASAADTPARLAVGANGETLVADSSATTGLRWQGDWNTGKNKIINGDFLINQRNFTSNTADGSFNFDRWVQANVGLTQTVTPQNFTPGTAPVAGYNGRTFLRSVITNSDTAGEFAVIIQNIEDVTILAGQTVTVSFWAKAASGTPKIAIELNQNFGTGGSPSTQVNTYEGQVTLSTSWARHSLTFTTDGLTGKTLGTTANTSFSQLALWLSAGSNFDSRTGSLGHQNNTFDIWGVQVEIGSVATPFTTATGTLAGELAACQRYYWRQGGSQVYEPFGIGSGVSTTAAEIYVKFPVTMRVSPTSLDGATLMVYDTVTTTTVTTVALQSNGIGKDGARVLASVASGLTQYRPYELIAGGSTNGYIGFNAEL